MSKEQQLLQDYQKYKVSGSDITVWDLVSILGSVYAVQKIGLHRTTDLLFVTEDHSRGSSLKQISSNKDLQNCLRLGAHIMEKELSYKTKHFLQKIQIYLKGNRTFDNLAQYITKKSNKWGQSIAFSHFILDLLDIKNNDAIHIYDHLFTQLPAFLQYNAENLNYNVTISKAPVYYLFLLIHSKQVSKEKQVIHFKDELSFLPFHNKAVLLYNHGKVDISEAERLIQSIGQNGSAILGFWDDLLSNPSEEIRLFFKKLINYQSIASMFIFPNDLYESYILLKIDFAQTHKKIRYHSFKRTLNELHLIYKDKEWHTWSTSHPIDYPDELHPSFTQPVPKTFRIHYSKKREQYRTKMLNEIATVYSIKDWSKFRLVEHHKTTQAIEATPKQYSYRLFYTKFLKKQEVPTSLFQTAAWIDPYADFLILKHSDRVHPFVISPDEKMPIFSSSLFYKVRIHDPDRYPPLFVASYLKRPEVQSFLRNGLPEGNPHLIRKQKIEQVEIPTLSLDDQSKIIADSQYYS